MCNYYDFTVAFTWYIGCPDGDDHGNYGHHQVCSSSAAKCIELEHNRVGTTHFVAVLLVPQRITIGIIFEVYTLFTFYHWQWFWCHFLYIDALYECFGWVGLAFKIV